MGFRLFASGLDVSERVELVIEDTADDNSLLSSAVRKLIEVDKVVAIIGPLLSKDMDLCAVEAKKAGIPLVTLARRGLVEGEGFFHFGLSVYNEAYELVRLAKQQLGIKRVAIVTSTDKNSQDTGFLFWDAAVMQGLTVAGFQTYQPQDTDFRYVVDKLSGLYYTHSRLDELLKMEQLRVQNKIQKKTRKNQQYYMLPPIVDYDAVFFADGARIATQIMPTFSYRDIDSVRFLGLSQWNTGDFFSRVENAAGLSFFTDMGFENPFFQRLKKGFFQDYQKSLDSLVVSGYEAAVFLKQAMKGKEMMTRSSLLQEMQRLFSEKQNSAFALNCFYQQLTLYTVKNQAAVNSSCL
jgi:ABC-type branched-subunit amino acid transport system substrate-binding protein